MARPTAFGREFGVVLDALERQRSLEADPVGQVESRPLVEPGDVQVALESQVIANESKAEPVTAPTVTQALVEPLRGRVESQDSAPGRGNNGAFEGLATFANFLGSRKKKKKE